MRLKGSATDSWLTALVVLTAIMLALPACKKGPAGPPADQDKASKALPPAPQAEPPIRLADVVRAARTWQAAPGLIGFVDKPAPPLTVRDLSRKTHNLADYRGRHVWLVYMAPWIGASKMELQDWAELRKSVPEAQLVVLGLSYLMEGRVQNTEAAVNQFVLANPVINFPVAVVKSEALPEPFGKVTDVPCSILIGPDGKIKVATLGPVPTSDLRRLLRAQ